MKITYKPYGTDEAIEREIDNEIKFAGYVDEIKAEFISDGEWYSVSMSQIIKISK